MKLGLLFDAIGSGRSLVLVAAPIEAVAVARGLDSTVDPAWWRPHRLRDDIDLVVTGIGKANSAAATARLVCEGDYSCCINLGVCGALPGSDLTPGNLIVADRSILADEGVESENTFESIASLGFPPGLGEIDAPIDSAMSAIPDRRLLSTIRPVADAVGAIATVSTCSGTNRLANAIMERTGAIGEAMEGAAIGMTLANLVTAGHHATATPFLEVRAVSNTTGDRSVQIWDISAACARLSHLASTL